MNLVLTIGPNTLRRNIDRWLQHHEKMPFCIYVPAQVANMFLLRQLQKFEEYAPHEKIHGLSLPVDQFLMHNLAHHKKLIDHVELLDDLKTFDMGSSPDCLVWIEKQTMQY